MGTLWVLVGSWLRHLSEKLPLCFLSHFPDHFDSPAPNVVTPLPLIAAGGFRHFIGGGEISEPPYSLHLPHLSWESGTPSICFPWGKSSALKDVMVILLPHFILHLHLPLPSVACYFYSMLGAPQPPLHRGFSLQPHLEKRAPWLFLRCSTWL
ncbi:unnamed protein product [Lepidochelys olivacea]